MFVMRRSEESEGTAVRSFLREGERKVASVFLGIENPTDADLDKMTSDGVCECEHAGRTLRGIFFELLFSVFVTKTPAALKCGYLKLKVEREREREREGFCH